MNPDPRSLHRHNNTYAIANSYLIYVGGLELRNKQVSLKVDEDYRFQ